MSKLYVTWKDDHGKWLFTELVKSKLSDCTWLAFLSVSPSWQKLKLATSGHTCSETRLQDMYHFSTVS